MSESKAKAVKTKSDGEEATTEDGKERTKGSLNFFFFLASLALCARRNFWECSLQFRPISAQLRDLQLFF